MDRVRVASGMFGLGYFRPGGLRSIFYSWITWEWGKDCFLFLAVQPLTPGLG